MFRILLSTVVLGVAAAGGLLVIGCASQTEQPYSVTGNSPEAYDRLGNYHPDWVGKPWLNPRYNDDKGHYHPEWVGEPGR